MKNIVIIGTSNSILKHGWVADLSSNPEYNITNYSIGRVSCLHHINMIIKNWDSLLSADVVVVDHYINDIMHYNKLDFYFYNDLLDELYYLLSENSSKVFILYLPVFNPDLTERLYKNKLVNLCGKYGLRYLDFFDLNKFDFIDKYHINKSGAKFISSSVVDYISCEFDVEDEFNSCSSFLSTRVVRVPASEFTKESRVFSYSNSLVSSIDYIKLSKSFYLSDYSGLHLIGVSYINVFDFHIMSISNDDNNINIVLPGEGYYTELLAYGDVKSNTLVFHNVGKISHFKVAGGRRLNIKEGFNFPEAYLVDFLFYNMG